MLSSLLEFNTIFYALLCSFACSIMLTRFRKWKSDPKEIGFFFLKTAALFAADYLFSILGILIGHLISDAWQAFLQFYFSVVGIALIAEFLYKDYTLKTKTIYISLFVTTWWLLPSISFIFSGWFAGIDHSSVAFSLAFSLPRVILLIILIVLLILMDLDALESRIKGDIILFEGVCLAVCVIHFIVQANMEVLPNSYICLMLWVFEIIIYVFYWMFLKEASLHYENEIQNRTIKADLAHFENLQVNYEQMRMLKHDLKNQYAYLSLLYEQGKEEEAKNYFAEMAKDAKGILNITTTGNITVDIAMSLLQDKADKANITVSSSVAVRPSLSIKESDLFSLLSNLFDNAFEGASASEADNKKIQVQLYQKDSYLMLNVSNSVLAGTSDSLKTTKKEPGHGYGHKIVQNIVTKYNGDILYSVNENDMFEVKAMLALKESEAAL